MRMHVKGKDLNSIDEASFRLLDALKNLLAEWVGARESSQNRALDLLQSSKGFDPVQNPQSLVMPKSLSKERPLDRRLPVRKAA